MSVHDKTDHGTLLRGLELLIGDNDPRFKLSVDPKVYRDCICMTEVLCNKLHIHNPTHRNYFLLLAVRAFDLGRGNR